MFGIGSTELIVILLVALVVLGPKNLAGISRTLGRIMGEFRRVSTDFQRTLNAEAAADDLREKEEQRKREVAASQAQQTAAVATGPKTSAQADATASDSQPEVKSTQAGSADVPYGQAGQGSQQKQAEVPEDGGMELAPPPDSPLARALAQTSAEAARAETVIAQSPSQAEQTRPETGEVAAAGSGHSQAAGSADTDGKTDATTGGRTGVSA